MTMKTSKAIEKALLSIPGSRDWFPKVKLRKGKAEVCLVEMWSTGREKKTCYTGTKKRVVKFLNECRDDESCGTVDILDFLETEW